MLIQNAEVLLKPQGQLILDSLESFKNDGTIKKVGVSIYDFKILQKILDKKLNLILYNFHIIFLTVDL